jgi:transposase
VEQTPFFNVESSSAPISLETLSSNSLMSRAREVFNVSGLVIIIEIRESISYQDDPEVKTKPERCQFSAEYKRRILEEADACTEAGQVGALLRREELYSLNLTHWRQQMSKGARKGLSPKKARPEAEPLANENAAIALVKNLSSTPTKISGNDLIRSAPEILIGVKLRLISKQMKPTYHSFAK